MVMPACLSPRPTTLPRLLAAALLLTGATAALPLRAQTIEGDGLRPGAAWPRWQGRIGQSPAEPAWGEPLRRALPSFALLGDYYPSPPERALPGRYSGSLRATGGLLVGSHGQPWGWAPGSATALLGNPRVPAHPLGLAPMAEADELPASLPYLGIGYTGVRALDGAGWGFSADLGVVALRPRSVVRLGQQSVGDLLRELQLSPMLQLGVSYSF